MGVEVIGIADTVRKVATEMMNTSMQDIDASVINKWANKLCAVVDKADELLISINSYQINSSKAREALKQIKEMSDEYFLGVTVNKDPEVYLDKCGELANAALSAPPRNCDAFSKAEVLEELDDRSFSKEDTIEWLYSKVGEIWTSVRLSLCDTSSEGRRKMNSYEQLREALKCLRDASREFCHLINNSKYIHIMDKYKYVEVANIRDAIANAGVVLSAPPRNCDVGTPAEQKARYEVFCKECQRITWDLPCDYNFECIFKWEQKPYEEDKNEH